MKYIDAEKLIALLEQRKKQLAKWTDKEYANQRIDEIDCILDVDINSLQQEQPDVDIREEIKKLEFMGSNDNHNMDKRKMSSIKDQIITLVKQRHHSHKVALEQEKDPRSKHAIDLIARMREDSRLIEVIDTLSEESENHGCGVEFPYFGANYPDAKCIDGYLWDMDSYEDGVYTIGGDDPCPICNTEEWLKDVLDDEIFNTKDEALEYVKMLKTKYKHKDSLPEETCKDSLQVPETCKENADSFTDDLEEAAEGYVAQRVHGELYAKAKVPESMNLKFGDKVKIIIIKDND